MSTMFYCVFEKPPELIPVESWKPWINCKPEEIDMTRRLVVHRFIRDRGGIGDLRACYLYEHSSETPCHRNGSPKQMTALEYSLAPID